MNKIKRILFISLLVSLLIIPSLLHAERGIKVTSKFDGKTVQEKYSTGNNFALIIGINKYDNHPDLKTAVNDADAVAQILQEKYFFAKENIILIKDEDATKMRILKEFRDLGKLKIKKGDNLIIYYAGHGWYDDYLDAGYWVTTEATKNPTTYLENNIIYKNIKALDKQGIQHVLLVSDSCFAGSFAKEHREIETDIDDRYFQEKFKKPSRSILASGGLEPVADAGKSGHSVFSYYFLKTLRDNEKPYISSKQVGSAVEMLVTRNSAQTPINRYIYGAGDEDGQFFFINSAGTGAGFKPAPTKHVASELNTEAERLMKEREEFEAEKTRYEKEKELKAEAERLRKEKEAFEAKKEQEKKLAYNNYAGSDDIIERDGQYEKYADGIVYDKETGLEWYAGPDKDTNWDEAKNWVNNLKVDGGGWRMPSRKELKGLYKRGRIRGAYGTAIRNITPLLDTTGWYVWSDETKGASAWIFYFDYTGYGYWNDRSYSRTDRAFAVRSRRR